MDTSGIEDLADSAEQAEKVISETTESTKKFSETLGGLGDGTDGIGPDVYKRQILPVVKQRMISTRRSLKPLQGRRHQGQHSGKGKGGKACY